MEKRIMRSNTMSAVISPKSISADQEQNKKGMNVIKQLCRVNRVETVLKKK